MKIQWRWSAEKMIFLAKEMLDDPKVLYRNCYEAYVVTFEPLGYPRNQRVDRQRFA
jgi:hypothetical protein